MTPATPRPRAAAAQAGPLFWVGRGGAALLVLGLLLSGMAGGLLRAGVALPVGQGETLLGQAAVMHAALMICGFLGTVIGIERAVALAWRPAWLAPLASALGGWGLLAGQIRLGSGLIVVAATLFGLASALIVRRQRAAHTVVLLLAALAWLAGSVRFALGLNDAATLAAWFGFLVMTIAAERLEMTRLMRRRPGAQPLFFAVLIALMLAMVLSALVPVAGGLLFGAALVLLAVWLGVFDIARLTLRAHGLSRYMAVCLLGGYVWLAVAGLAWAATAAGWPARDAALHALGLGFIFSMIMGHAPVILPAIARVKLGFSGAFYLPLALLHLGLLLRLALGAADPAWRGLGAALNVAAVIGFALTVLMAALRWRRGETGRQRPAPPQPVRRNG